MELKDLTTLFAASIAAVASMASLGIGLAEKRRTELREAQRAALEAHVVALGESMYAVIAASQRMASSVEDSRFRKHKERATQSALDLDRVRRQVRYSLWGINDQLHDLVLLPRWIEFMRGNRAATDELIARATELRAIVDEVIRVCYLEGRSPSLPQAAEAKVAGEKLRSSYHSAKASSSKTTESDDDDA